MSDSREEPADATPPHNEASSNDDGQPIGEDYVPDDSGDPFAPPKEPCECWCLHCRRTFSSEGIWFQKVIGDDHFHGFWMCPTPNCGGAGFTFDIFPTDPTHPANDGWTYDDDEDDGEEFDESEFDDEEEPEKDYDPAEPRYAELDDHFANDPEDDLEGEEWKLGLAPGERPPESAASADTRESWEEEEKQYDMPDERPRILDWTNRKRDERRGPDGFKDDDIPF